MAKATLTCFCILICLNLVSTAEVQKRGNEGNRKRTGTDPVSNFFSDLGDLFFDIDRSLAAQIAPKVEYGEGLAVQTLKPSNEYFSNVQNNYRTLQKRLGNLVSESMAPKSIHGDYDLSTVSPPKFEEGNEKSFASTPASRINTGTFAMTREQYSDSPHTSSPVRDVDISNEECSAEILNNPFLDTYTREKCSQRLKRHVDNSDRLKKSRDRLMLESKRKNQLLIPIDSELETFPYGFLRRGGDVAESDSKPEGRIIGDVLYSESLFDRNIRQLLREHGKWILDNPLLIRWRKSSKTNSNDNGDVTTKASATETEVTTVESSADLKSETETTQAYIPITNEYKTEIPVSEKTYSKNQLPVRSAFNYRILDNEGIIEEEVDVVLKPETNLETVRSPATVDELKENPDSKATVILAFTPNGVPLKLRLGPEIGNPVRFLHKVLKSAGVSLNVPVKSYDDIEPVGKEVLNFGAGVLTRAVYFDLSNADELKSLLKTLMKSKASGKSKV